MKRNIVLLRLTELPWNWRKISAGSVQMYGTPIWCIRDLTKLLDWGRRRPALLTAPAQTCDWHQALLPSACSGKLAHALDSAWTGLHPMMALIYLLRCVRHCSYSVSAVTP